MARRLSRRAMAEYMAAVILSGEKSGPAVKRLAGYLVDSGRTRELTLILRDVAYLLSQQGIVNATVTSARELEAETLRAIERFIAASTKASKVSVDTVLEPAVLGGVKLSLPGKELDQTIAAQLTILKTRYKKA